MGWGIGAEEMTRKWELGLTPGASSQDLGENLGLFLEG